MLFSLKLDRKRLAALEDLAASIQVDTSAGIDTEEQSAFVIGNVSVETLKTLKTLGLE